MSNKRKHVLFIASESTPLCKSGGLADVVGSLPSALSKCHVRVSVILPYYSLLSDEIKSKCVTVKEDFILLGLTKYYCGLKTLKFKNRDYYFIDNMQFFHRDRLYGYNDEDERFLFFSNAVLAMLPYIGEIDILHCHDWQSGAVPVLLNMYYRHLEFYRNIRTVFTIHNLKYQGRFSISSAARYLGIDEKSSYFKDVEFFGDLNIMKAALYHSDYVTTVSQTYSREIMTSDFGEGMDGILRDISHKLSGIVNGIDLSYFDPSTSNDIYAPYHDSMGKAVNKAAFQEEFGLEVAKDKMMIGIVSRLEEQKGFDLILDKIEEMKSLPVQFVLLGTGNKYYEDRFRILELENKGSFRCFIMYNEKLAHKIYASSDLFLMPSLFEPCGIGQMIAMRYGTLPLVRETGGLKDTVTPYNKFTNEGNGFSFASFRSDEMLTVFKMAHDLYQHKPKVWNMLVTNAMHTDFSWKKSAQEYNRIYQKLLG
ncbi:MAG: glycogen synthase [Clostridia bacterium]|nr:glycogen synthase [Clostridia bacterium]